MNNPEVTHVRLIWSQIAPDIEEHFGKLWNVPELPLMEYQSADFLCQLLERHGFKTERGVGGVPTAFAARIRNAEGPVIGILAEYDALPTLHNEAVPYRKGNRRLPGHGCGHNHIGPANTGAGIAAAKALLSLGLAGGIDIIGCPAEEIGWGKPALQEAGVFDGIDVLLTSHGDYQNGSLSRPCQSIAGGEFWFLGAPGHGGKTPKANALDVAEEAYSRFSKAREQIPGLTAKHVFRYGGVTPGVTPEEVRLWASVRHPEYEGVLAGYALMAETFRQVAVERGVGFEEHQITSGRGYLGNDVVGRVLDKCLREVGPPQWSDADIVWMQELAKAVDPDKPFDLHREIGYFDEGLDYYGQDDGDVSWQIPLGRVNWAYPSNVPIHHWAWTALSGHASSSPGPLMASEALAMAAIHLLAHPEAVSAAKRELKSRTAGIQIDHPTIRMKDLFTTDPQSFWDATWGGEQTGA
ncbi:hypothetical protein [Agrobacterium tumefaciens]|uniref:hypothetical protein n=1 Tax=Agrobacterium tumefaciens TaxID=358 RepID=UPI00023A1D9D|nr:amidohydrolase [Agrobacterium tumefaciens 5A]